MDPYMGELLNCLGALLTNTDTVAIHEQAITAIGAVGDRSPAEFLKYYDTFMGLLHSVLVRYENNEQPKTQEKKD